MVRHRSRWWAALAGAVVLPSVMWLGPTLAGPSGGVRYRALVNPSVSGAVAVKADGSSVVLGDGPASVTLTLVSDADVVDARVTSSGDIVVLQTDGSITAAGGRGLSCAPSTTFWPAVGFALTGGGRGAWIAASNGAVTGCGTAPTLASTPLALDAPVVGIAASADGGGALLLTASGEVRALGTVRARGDGHAETSRFVAMETTADGYWLARADGEVQAFGDAPALGDVQPASGTVVDLAATPDGAGYRALTSTGTVLSAGPVAPIGGEPAGGVALVDDTFETPTGWTTWWGPPLPEPAAVAHTGTGALRVPGHWSTFANVTRTIEGLQGGRSYELSYWVNGDAVVGGQFNWSDPDWRNVTSGRLPRTPMTAGTWTQAKVQLTAPAGAQRLWLGLFAPSDFVLDDVQLRGAPGSGGGVTTPPVTTASPGTTAPGTTTPATTGPGATTPTTTPSPGPTTTAPRPPATTVPPAPLPTPRVGRPPSGPDEIDARVCGSSRLLGGPISAAAAGALYPGRTVVTVPAGDDSGVFSGGAGTVYWLAPGRHTLGSSPFGQVQPKDGDVFIGAPGAVLDGAGVNRYAFVGHAQRVAIRYLTVTGFDAPVNEGVVNHDSGDHWLIEFSTVRANGGGGMMAGSGQVVRQSCLAENGQYGFNAYQGGDGIADVVFDHNEIMGNNTGDWEVRQPGCGCTGGGKFWAVRGARITNNWVHDNHSVGLWADTNNVDFLFERNVVDHNDNVGIWYEISYNARIVDNLLTRNGWVSGRSNQGAPAPAIYLSESGGDSRLSTKNAGAPLIEIMGNQLVDNFSGITLYENTNRFCNSNGNSSTGYCTPFVGNGKIPAPQQYGYGQPINPNHQCTAPGIASEPLFTDCRWRTQHVSIHDNDLSFDPGGVPCAGKFCGAMSLYGSGADNQAWQPYTVAGTLDALTFGQDNRWRNNVYRGPWRFMTRFGDQVDQGTWRGTYAQDQGSTFG